MTTYSEIPEKNTIVLDSSEQAQLRDAEMSLPRKRFGSKYIDPTEPLTFDPKIYKKAGERLRGKAFDKIKDFARESNEEGVVLIKGVPIDECLVSTPDNGYRPSEKFPTSENVSLIISYLMGDVFSFADEKKGRMVQDVAPMKGKENNQENSGSKSWLKMHTEDSFHPLTPDFLTLLCLRPPANEDEGATLAGPMLPLIDKLDKEEVNMLKKDVWEISAPVSFNLDFRRKMSVIKEDEKGIKIFYDDAPKVGMHSSRKKAAKIYRELGRLLSENLYGRVMAAGDLIVFDNRRCTHGRTVFNPSYDGNDRWLQRTFVTTDIAKYREHFSQGTYTVKPFRDICDNLSL